MSSRYIITRTADLDIFEIGCYIVDHSDLDTASKFVDKLYARFEAIAETPGLGRPRNELAADVRSLAVGFYVVFYAQIDGTVTILRVIHGARDLDSLNISFDP